MDPGMYSLVPVTNEMSIGTSTNCIKEFGKYYVTIAMSTLVYDEILFWSTTRSVIFFGHYS
jgi:hypothetical protein